MNEKKLSELINDNIMSKRGIEQNLEKLLKVEKKVIELENVKLDCAVFEDKVLQHDHELNTVR